MLRPRYEYGELGVRVASEDGLLCPRRLRPWASFRARPSVFCMACFTSRPWACPPLPPGSWGTCFQVWLPQRNASFTLHPVESLTVGLPAEVGLGVLSGGFEFLAR